MTDILGQFRDEEPPPSRVDIQRAVRSGRRQQRIRTAIAAGGAALAVAVAGLTAPAWLAPPARPRSAERHVREPPTNPSLDVNLATF